MGFCVNHKPNRLFVAERKRNLYRWAYALKIRETCDTMVLHFPYFFCANVNKKIGAHNFFQVINSYCMLCISFIRNFMLNNYSGSINLNIVLSGLSAVPPKAFYIDSYASPNLWKCTTSRSRRKRSGSITSGSSAIFMRYS